MIITRKQNTDCFKLVLHLELFGLSWASEVKSRWVKRTISPSKFNVSLKMGLLRYFNISSK